MLRKINYIIKHKPHFSYTELLDCINIVSKYNIQIGSIGKSALGQELYLLKLGKGPFRIHVNAAVHANEWITTPIIIRFLAELCETTLLNQLWNQITLDIVPMVNPDGVNLVCDKKLYDINEYKRLLELNEFNTNFSGWKSNLNGVDLNRNFPAQFDQYKCIISKNNRTDHPSAKFYAGPYPLSEVESHALYKLCKTRNYQLAISLHTQGREIYYSFNELEPMISYDLAQMYSNVSGYALEQPEPDSSFAGFKDWFIQEFRKPGFTFELGEGVNPLNYSTFNEIYEEVYPLLYSVLQSHEYYPKKTNVVISN